MLLLAQIYTKLGLSPFTPLTGSSIDFFSPGDVASVAERRRITSSAAYNARLVVMATPFARCLGILSGSFRDPFGILSGIL